ncbi:MAG: tRNA (adenosine(37)-N6)-threonylcarbamoyltransferase complex transferase subunit TsaD, partial [Mailhella sp.]
SYLLAIAETLTIKTSRAMAEFSPKSIVVAGGVAANSVIRREFSKLAQKHGLPLIIPRLALCGDNAAMVAKAGWHMARAGRFHSLALSAIPRGQSIPQDWTSMEASRS